MNRFDLSWDDAALKVTSLQKSGRKVVFTNGCFDVLHLGHIRYLKEARDLGDFLLIGLNSDQSIQRIKGRSRPIFQVQDRAEMLMALEVVDAVVVFEQDTPLSLIQRLQPKIYVKGGDYVAEELPEFSVVTAYHGQVKCLSFYKGYSTTAILEKGFKS